MVENVGFEVKWERRNLEVELMKGKGRWICLKVKGKDGKEKKFVMKEVEGFYWEREEIGI